MWQKSMGNVVEIWEILEIWGNVAGNLGNRRDVAKIREISEILKFRSYGLVSYPSLQSA